MKRMVVIFFFCLLVVPGCEMREQELRMQQKEAELNQKEQELLFKERSLQLKEEELMKREQITDSTKKGSPDTASAAHYNPELVGSWLAKMNCIETSCPGSAVGDTKTEQWNILFQDQHLIVKVMVNQRLVRTYTGTYNGTVIEVASQQPEETAQSSAMVVHLQQTGKEHLEGRREITRPTGCKIVYALDLVKQ